MVATAMTDGRSSWGDVVANHLPLAKRVDVVRHLVEGMSVRGTSRLTDVSLPTVLSTLLRMGYGCDQLHNKLVRDLDIREIQLDEIWSYVQKKQARLTENDPYEFGDAYTYLGMARTKKLILSYIVGKRDEAMTQAFITDLRARLVVMPAMTSDGFAPYISAIGASFGTSIDYVQTVKNYGSKGRRNGGSDHRYEPPRQPFITKKVIYGAPNLDKASTAYMERNNGTMRHHIGRMRRLCYAFSKKLPNHRAAVALSYVHYNLCHVVSTLRVTPAMAAHVTDHVWELRELLDALMTAAPCDAPIKQSLTPRVPEVTHRELPAGRGFLRVIDGGKAKPVAPTPIVPTPTPVVATVVDAAPTPKRWEQLDLLSWRPKERQLLLF